MRQAPRRQRVGNRTRDRVGAAQHGDARPGDARRNQALRLSRDRARFGVAVRTKPQLDLFAGPAGPQLLWQSCLVVGDERRGRGHDAARASVVASKGDRQRIRKASAKALEARARRPSESIDALIIIPHHEWPIGIASFGVPATKSREAPLFSNQLDQPLLREIQILVLIDEHMRKARAVSAALRRLLFQEPHRQGQEIFEIQQSLLAAGPLIRSEKSDAGLHELHSLGRLRVCFNATCGRGPGGELLERDELLLQALQHLERRRHQVVRPLVAGEDRIAQLPHQLASKDPALGSGKDSEARRNSDQPAVRAKPAERNRMEGAYRRRGFANKVFDSLAHLRCRPLGERHHQDRCGRGAAGDQPAEALRDHCGLSGPRSRHHAYRATSDRGSARLFDSQLHYRPPRLPGGSTPSFITVLPACRGGSGRGRATTHQPSGVGPARPIRTRTLRTFRPRSIPFKRETIVSESSRSWCARAGLDVVTTRVPECSSTASHRRAGSGPIKVRNAEATWVPSKRPPPGCRRSTRGRILPSLSTG